MPNTQISFTIEPTKVDRIDALKIGTEARSSVLRRIIDVGLPIVEARAKEMEKLE